MRASLLSHCGTGTNRVHRRKDRASRPAALLDRTSSRASLVPACGGAPGTVATAPCINRLLLFQTEGCSNQGVRRLLPSLLLAVFLLPLFAPLLAFGQAGGGNLPACCRREGKHRCATTMAEKGQAAATETAPRWTAPADRCPFCPASLVSAHRHEALAVPPAQAHDGEISSYPAGLLQAESRYRLSQDRSRQKRGPPSPLS